MNLCAVRTRPPLLDEPRDDELPVHGALLNWAEWCRVRWRPGRAGSAEGAYLPEAQALFNPPEPRTVVDQRLAVEVNSALLSVPERNRTALRLRYHERMSDRAICRIARVRPEHYQGFMRQARLMLRNVLRRRGITL